MAQNSWNGVGRFTRDPELRYTPNGKAVTNFTLAVQRDYKDDQGNRPADFINIVVWGPHAETIAQHKQKGDRVSVTGRLESRSYENQEGNMVYVTEVNANEVHFLDNAGDGVSDYAQTTQTQQTPQTQQGFRKIQSNNNRNTNNKGQANNGNRGGYNNRGR